VAVIGSGPSGSYAAAALVRHGGVEVDVFERVPCPFGLVRYGVAPDHPKTKSIAATFERIYTDSALRFLGNVEVGRDVSIAELRGAYDAVIVAAGAPASQRLGIPGESLTGVHPALDLVHWYSGHPDAGLEESLLDGSTIAVVGAGNVALDVARMLLRPGEALSGTDVPDRVLGALVDSRVRDIHLLVRRGPQHARWTTPELKEVLSLEGVNIDIEPRQVQPPLAESSEPAALRNIAVLREHVDAPAVTGRRTLHFHFHTSPVEFYGDDRVQGIRLHSTSSPHGEREPVTLPADVVFTAIGFHGVPLPGVPFAVASGTVPQRDGRVLDEAGAPIAGLYVTGWLRRGATGVVGTNRRDANQTVVSVLEDLTAMAPQTHAADPVAGLLHDRGVEVVTWTGWENIRAEEARRGRRAGRVTSKIATRPMLLEAAAGAAGRGRS
jgi:ferredoxin--NADP+ reductase